jgi:hypothetical protein
MMPGNHDSMGQRGKEMLPEIKSVEYGEDKFLELYLVYIQFGNKRMRFKFDDKETALWFENEIVVIWGNELYNILR